jgi:hypothetical protein
MLRILICDDILQELQNLVTLTKTIKNSGCQAERGPGDLSFIFAEY